MPNAGRSVEKTKQRGLPSAETIEFQLQANALSLSQSDPHKQITCLPRTCPFLFLKPKNYSHSSMSIAVPTNQLFPRVAPVNRLLSSRQTDFIFIFYYFILSIGHPDLQIRLNYN